MLLKIKSGEIKIGLIGLGYVGLPLAVEFGRKYDTVGFDVKPERLEALRRGEDTTLETSSEDLKAAIRLKYSGDPADLKDRDIFIVTVPTPVDQYNRPDLTPLYKASETVGKVMKPGAIVVYESTVYPGCTEEECVPVLEKFSGLKFNTDFFCGYSPERINPGDKEHTLTKIQKITSGSTPETADIVDALYGSILKNGTHRASSMKVAEAAKVIENSQRDLNIAFVNELAKIFRLIGIDTNDVLAAAGTKWNFLKFKPGLVGGHCIGVDPYYLTYKAESLGYHSQIILSGRRINDDMGKYVAESLVKNLIKAEVPVRGAKVAILGFTFKENCPDTRNTKVIDIYKELGEYGITPIVVDPAADADEAKRLYGITFETMDVVKNMDAVIVAVAHNQFTDFSKEKISQFFNPENDRKVFMDIKGIFNRKEFLTDDYLYWRL